jgi:hypothetical protein
MISGGFQDGFLGNVIPVHFHSGKMILFNFAQKCVLLYKRVYTVVVPNQHQKSDYGNQQNGPPDQGAKKLKCENTEKNNGNTRN